MAIISARREMSSHESSGYAYGVTLRTTRLDRPIENPYVEGFAGRFRDEYLNDHLCVSLANG